MNLLRVKEAAEMLSVHPNTIRNYIKSGKLPAKRIGTKLIRIELADLQNLKESK